MLDVEALLAPIADLPPAGADLVYDPDWLELDTLSQGKPEQQFGKTIIAAEEPPWTDIERRGRELLKRSKDLRSAGLVVRAWVRQEQFSGLLPGLKLIGGLLSRYWDSVHPQLDASDGDDPTERLNALAVLADPQMLLRDVRAANLFRSKAHGALTIRAIEVSLGKVPAGKGDAAPAPAQLEQQIAGVLGQDPELAALVAASLAEARALAKLLDDKVGSDRSPDFKPLIGTLYTVDQLVQRMAPAAPQAAGADAGADVDVGVGGEGGAPARAAAGAPRVASAVAGEILSRTDVVLLLDKIIVYLEKSEPTNPTPLILHRAKRLMGMNFMEALADLAPDGVKQIKVVTGNIPTVGGKEEK